MLFAFVVGSADANRLRSVALQPHEHRLAAPLTLLPQIAGNASPSCLEGSAYGLYYTPAANASSTLWTLWFQSGGWCYDEASCLKRAGTPLGSSKAWEKTAGGCTPWNVVGGSVTEDAHCIYLPYCDGASFSGYRPAAWPVPGREADTLTFRGLKNLDSAVEWALQHGLANASQFVVAGGSAGGLSTFLHADRVIGRVRAASPDVQAWAVPVAGYFLDHGNYARTSGTPNTPSWEQATFAEWMEYIFTMQNLTFGPDGGLSPRCKAEHPEKPYKCFMSPYMVDTVQERLYMLNSKFDTWQLNNVQQMSDERTQRMTGLWKSAAEKQERITSATKAFGEDFVRALDPLAGAPQRQTAASVRAKAGFITSCLCHECPWWQLALEGKSALGHYASWAEGGDEGVIVDPRGPNADGELEQACRSMADYTTFEWGRWRSQSSQQDD